MKKTIKKYLDIFNMIVKNKYICLVFIIASYLIIDIIFRYFIIKNIYFYSIRNISPLLFTVSMISLSIIIMSCLKKKYKIIYYIISILFYLFMCLVQYFHYKILGTVFTFSELFLLGEGLDFINAVTDHISYKLIIVLLGIFLIIILTIYSLKNIEDEEINIKKKLILLFLSIITQLIGISFLYLNNNGYNSNNEHSPIFNYYNYTIPYRSIQVSGMIQYPLQDFIMYFVNIYKDKMNLKKYKEELNKYLETKNYATENEYTGIFKDKNLIYIMLESGDDWLINKKDMPTLYKMQQEGWNFTNRYAPQFYSGYTFNSEFAANTGIYSMDGYDNYKNNYFPYSLPNLFKNAGYDVNSFHMNNKEFYNRDEYHKSFGYTNLYSGYYKNKTYEKEGYSYLFDEDWINNDATYNLLVSKENKFMSFLITYTMHMTYMNNSICNDGYREGKVSYDEWNDIEKNCLRYLAKQSDKLFERLLERLEEDKLLDDTIIIIFSDHYAYGITDTKFLSEQKKTTNTNLFQKTPLIIWGKDIEQKNIDIIMDTADLVPTIANLFDLKYESKNYLSTDVFSENHENFVYFQYGYSLDSDGNYVDSTKNDAVNNLIRYNKYMLQTDYFINN